MGQTIAQKILAAHSSRKECDVGEILNPQVDVAMSHENAALVSKVFKTIGVERVWDADKIVIPLDHRVPANDIKTAEGHKWIRGIVKEYGIKNFYDIRAGICHQVLPEKGHVKPGMLIVGTDSHTTTYGGLGAFSTGIGATEMAAVWATGSLWLRVPETLRINVEGNLGNGVYSKDVILKVIGKLGADGADYKSCEFYGDTVENFSVGSRMTICNQAMEMGAKAAICPPDEKTFAYLRERTDGRFDPVYADADAAYEAAYDFAAGDIAPQVSCPHNVDNVKDVDDPKIAGLEIQQAVLGSCTNGRLEDLEAAARIM
ncbi:MAG: 3-isopropylmalate dehydratase large subunit, partial [Candidatus Anoxymicrobium japonicum]